MPMSIFSGYLVVCLCIALLLPFADSSENSRFKEVHADLPRPPSSPLVGPDSLLSTLLCAAGPALVFALQMSCVVVAVDIQNSKSVKKLSSLPFASLLANGVVWGAYGWLKLDKTIIVPNMLSVVVAMYCMFVYYDYAVRKPVDIYAAALFISAIGLWLMIAGDTASVGVLGCALSVAMSGSPLAVIRTVIREQSTAAMPFWISVVTWFNNLSWLLYGMLIIRDNMIIIPNTLGLVLASVQMGLFIAYGLPPKQLNKPADELAIRHHGAISPNYSSAV
jgi:uncharacterized protein with PQ loop repeat